MILCSISRTVVVFPWITVRVWVPINLSNFNDWDDACDDEDCGVCGVCGACDAWLGFDCCGKPPENIIYESPLRTVLHSVL